MAEAPVLEEGSDGVRIMTVHKAKGLEFPVVILADMTAKMARAPASRYIDPKSGLCAIRIAGWSPVELLEQEDEELKRDEAEGVRIAYVAATRARDLLVVPAVGRQARGGMVQSAQLGSLSVSCRSAMASLSGRSRLPSFGNDSVFERPELAFEQRQCPTRSAHLRRPGGRVRRRMVGSRELDLGAKPLFGIRQENLFGQGNRALQRGSGLEAVHRLARRPRGGCRAGLAAQPPDADGHGSCRGHERRLDPRSRPSSFPGTWTGPPDRRYGALVHAVLATMPLDADPQQIEQAARLQGRILGATEHEIESAAAVAELVVRHPIMERARRAAASGHCRRETPIALRQPDGAIVDGVVDLAFLENDTWIVVDFKTDRELERGLAVYQRQVGLYAAAIQAATGLEDRPGLDASLIDVSRSPESELRIFVPKNTPGSRYHF